MPGIPINPEAPGAFGVVYVDGKTVRLWTLSPEERAKVYQQLEEEAKAKAVETPIGDRTPTQQEAAFADTAAKAGIDLPDTGTASIEAVFTAAGIDMENPTVQALMANMPQSTIENENLLRLTALSIAANPEFSNVPTTLYSTALAASGFDSAYRDPQQTSYTMAAKEGVATTPVTKPGGRFETQPDTGWVRFANGVLVDPETPGPAGVHYDPASTAPGSSKWRTEVAGQWSDDKAAEWKKRLHQFGYLSADEAKVKGVDTRFLDALSAYHAARYANGGKAIAGDLNAYGATGGVQAGNKIVQLEDVSASIRADVRDQYRVVFGTDPSDGDVNAWTAYIIKKGEDLQRTFRDKYGTPSPDKAQSEATALMTEKIQQSPQGQFVGDSLEENTRLRDALQRAVQVTNSLAG